MSSTFKLAWKDIEIEVQLGVQSYVSEEAFTALKGFEQDFESSFPCILYIPI